MTRDLVIVGAGAAGLTAARAARERGLDALVLEAKDRIGGRAHTDPHTFGLPLDLGCHWLHSADVNPWTELARGYGLTLGEGEVDFRLWLDGRFASAAERRDYRAFVAAADAAAFAAAQAGRDVSLAEVTPREDAFTRHYDRWIAATCGADPDEVSTVDFAAYRDTGVNLALREGYGTLVSRYGAGVVVELATPVTRIDWSRDPVRVDSERGRLEARAVLLTVSTGVLAAEAIRFEPPLPDWKRAAIDANPLGLANKLVLEFDGNVFGTGRASVAGPRLGFELRPFGRDLAIGWVAGRLASALERAGEGAAVDLALDELTALFGSSLRGRLRRTLCTAWESDPQVRGAYSVARPGAGGQRPALARALDGRVFFAGEATSVEFYSTTHGAYLSGRAAARDVADRLAATA